MKCILASDLHGYLPKLPSGDVLVLAGDLVPATWDYHSVEAQQDWLDNEFSGWLYDQGIPEVVITAGNHDKAMAHKRLTFNISGVNVNYLEDEFAEVLGLKVYGSPWSVTFSGRWVFNKPDDQLDEIFAKIPRGLDLCVVHGPPRGAGDLLFSGYRAGSRSLRNHLLRAEPRFCITGHLHMGAGKFELGRTTVINCALLNDDYELIREPVILEI